MDFYQSLVNPREEIYCKTWNLRFSLLPGHLRCFANLFGRSKPLKPLSVAKSLTTYLELSSMFLSGDRRLFSDYNIESLTADHSVCCVWRHLPCRWKTLFLYFEKEWVHCNLYKGIYFISHIPSVLHTFPVVVQGCCTSYQILAFISV